ncbi:olfactory receptor 4S1-like [Pygocentrus nattereri]|uniref:olfactory receptor 4S1-like n=1 Tax=Pygocentrus nattereri TaxID=42514 RepID=UPI0008144619|nr:olfactory receptor 4S1-like [Pygocentrus nattereri]
MMLNSSGEFMFVLRGLNDSRTNKHIYFAFGLVVYMVTVVVNLTLIITIILEKTLHEPMYLFICNLYVNGICGASAFYPKILADLFLDSNIISYTGCLIQMYIIYCYLFSEFTSLTVMAYDRYVAICKPLDYHSIMTPQKVANLMGFTWFFSFLETIIGVALAARLPLCGNVIEKIYCFNWDVVKLSCIDVTLNNVYGYILIFSHFSQCVFITVSYICIIRASLRSKTCLPHLITLINFTISVLSDSLCARYVQGQEVQALWNILGMEFLVVPPLLNPIIYGIRVAQIRSRFVRMYSHKINFRTSVAHQG